MSRLKISLLDNAITFAEDALSNAIVAEDHPTRWKFAILSLVQAIELSLKELLRIQHQILIYADVDKPTKTVSIHQAKTRLEKIANIAFSQKDNSALNTAIEARNNIVHHEIDAAITELRLLFGRLLAFLDDFHRKHLNEPLQDQIEDKLWQQGCKIKEYGEELFKNAVIRLKEEGLTYPGEIVACPECGWEALPVFGDKEKTCYVCGNFTDLVVCHRCHKVMFYGEQEEEGGKYYCYDCLCYISDDYWYESSHGK